MCAHRRSPFSVLLFAVFAAGLFVAASRAPDRGTSTGAPADVVMLDERFVVGDDDRLTVRVPDADVLVETGRDREVHVRIVLTADDVDRGRDYYARQRFRVVRESGGVAVTADPERNLRWNWRRDGQVRLAVHVVVPSRFSGDLRTSDGDVLLEALDGRFSIQTADGDIFADGFTGGRVELRTADGDIRIERVDTPGALLTVFTSDGDVSLAEVAADESRIRTSDGDIGVGRLRGRADVATSDGDIRIESHAGADLNLRTSDGDVVVDELVADRARIRIADGDLVLRSVDGPVEAVTSSGDITARLLKAAPASFRASDGDITVYVPAGLPLDVRLRGDDVGMDADGIGFSGRIEDEAAEGALNGGGPLVEARSSDGSVRLRVDR